MNNQSIKTNTTYIMAANDIKEVAEATQAKLDLAALNARVANIAAHRKAFLDGVEVESPAFSICSLVAQTFSIGRESDNYPAFSIPQDTIRVLLAARNAGIIFETIGIIQFYGDFSGIVSHNTPIEQNRDYNAWKEARDFRKNQTYTDL